VGGGVERNETGCERFVIDEYGDIERWQGRRGKLNMDSIFDMNPS